MCATFHLVKTGFYITTYLSLVLVLHIAIEVRVAPVSPVLHLQKAVLWQAESTALPEGCPHSKPSGPRRW